jgi:hypothetical protein
MCNGYDRAYVLDPFGNRIELLEREANPGRAATRPGFAVD